MLSFFSRSTTIIPRPPVCKDPAVASSLSNLLVCLHSIATGLVNFPKLPFHWKQECRGKEGTKQSLKSTQPHPIAEVDLGFYNTLKCPPRRRWLIRWLSVGICILSPIEVIYNYIQNTTLKYDGTCILAN